tara:strand:+ start:820 stop:1005 length:186 start_codon:yes stop_codon:yes gene_type:complete
MRILSKHWLEFDQIGLERDLVEESDCGIWFKNIGCSFCATDDQKKALAALNTKIQSLNTDK